MRAPWPCARFFEFLALPLNQRMEIQHSSILFSSNCLRNYRISSKMQLNIFWSILWVLLLKSGYLVRYLRVVQVKEAPPVADTFTRSWRFASRPEQVFHRSGMGGLLPRLSGKEEALACLLIGYISPSDKAIDWHIPLFSIVIVLNFEWDMAKPFAWLVRFYVPLYIAIYNFSFHLFILVIFPLLYCLRFVVLLCPLASRSAETLFSLD